MKKVELLAPAGNYESFLGAVHAGADAVYLGGSRFGARAFADNFSTEEIKRALWYAHLQNKKIYLTVNTLLKEHEMQELCEYLKPFYNEGLDGIIIQDLGAFSMIKNEFPKLPLHVSTQMGITGSYGAGLLKEMGAKRIVLARELSLSEIKAIKDKSCIEIEVFIHGAMCYAYSGQCLFSSILGGRSGNRGRCAQPCRLPYTLLENGREVLKDKYLLSLKDLCTLKMIPELIEAGIDSFKIEGRMKKPEYTAGVTSIYRKYLDAYYENGSFQIKEEDLAMIHGLYIRQGIQNGYYHRHNGKEMIALNEPGYQGTNEEILTEIRVKYLTDECTIPVTAKMTCQEGEPLTLRLSAKYAEITVFGANVQKARNAPITEDQLKKQLNKTGGTFFNLDQIEISLGENLFVSVKECNELRRQGLQELEHKLLENTFNRDKLIQKPTSKEFPNEQIKKDKRISCEVNNLQQYKAVSEYLWVSRIYLSVPCLEEMQAAGVPFVKHAQHFMASSYFMREEGHGTLKKWERFLGQGDLEGVLVKNLEVLAWLMDIGYSGLITADAGIYSFNDETRKQFLSWEIEGTYPYEWNEKEIRRDLDGKKELVVYGRIPLMVTANCVAKTGTGCQKDHCEKIYSLKDRYGKVFPVTRDCSHCYNVIYNSLVLSLHQPLVRAEEFHVAGFRFVFTTESEKTVKDVLSFFGKVIQEGVVLKPPYEEYTNGHFKRGVE